MIHLEERVIVAGLSASSTSGIPFRLGIYCGCRLHVPVILRQNRHVLNFVAQDWIGAWRVGFGKLLCSGSHCAGICDHFRNASYEFEDGTQPCDRG